MDKKDVKAIEVYFKALNGWLLLGLDLSTGANMPRLPCFNYFVDLNEICEELGANLLKLREGYVSRLTAVRK